MSAGADPKRSAAASIIEEMVFHPLVRPAVIGCPLSPLRTTLFSQESTVASGPSPLPFPPYDVKAQPEQLCRPRTRSRGELELAHFALGRESCSFLRRSS